MLSGPKYSFLCFMISPLKGYIGYQICFFFQQLFLATHYVIGVEYKAIDYMGGKPHFCGVHGLANSNLLFTTCQALNALFLLIFIIFRITL